MELNQLECDLMWFAKQSDYHGTLNQFLEWNPCVEKQDALEALRSLKRKHFVSTTPDLLNSWIGVTNAGHKKMGW